MLSELRLLRQESGQPSLGQLVKLSDHKFSKSTLDDQLAGRRTRLPSWRFVEAYVKACHEAARSTGLDVDQLGAVLGSVDEWRSRWLAALRGDLVVLPVLPRQPSTQAIDPREVEEYARRQFLAEHRTTTRKSPENFEHDPEASTSSFRAFSEIVISELADIPRDVGVLVVRNAIMDGERFQIEDDVVTIGRGAGNVIRLDHESVSRKHATIRRQGVRFRIADVGSINGTYLDQKLLTTESPLRSRQEVQIGIFRLLFIQGKKKSSRRSFIR
jgi:hypothetical protein